VDSRCRCSDPIPSRTFKWAFCDADNLFRVGAAARLGSAHEPLESVLCLRRALLMEYLPTSERAGVEELLEEAGIRKISPAVRLVLPLALCQLDASERSSISRP
jgi:hypothetical protein